MPRKRKYTGAAIVTLLTTLIIVGIIGLVWSSTEPKSIGEEVCDLKDNDGDGEIDEGLAVTCSQDTDCGASGEYGEKYCERGSVYIATYESKCHNEGACLSECTSKQTSKIIEECSDRCLNGRCVEN